MLYDGCEIALFTRDLEPKRDKFMATAREHGARIERMEGDTVAVFKVGIEDDSWDILVAFPQPRVVLVATHAGYLGEVLRRINGRVGPRALPDSLPEWKYVRTDGSLWAFRHFAKTGNEEDPSTPFYEQRAAMPDKDAIGVVLYFETRPKALAHIIYLSGEKSGEVITQLLSAGHDPAGFGQVAGTPTPIRGLARGVVDCTVSLENPQAASWLLFIFGGLLGHATYL